VKLLRLGCRSSACVLRRVPALRQFYCSFGSRNALWCESQCIEMPPTVSKLRGVWGGKCFQLHYTCTYRVFVVLHSFAFSIYTFPLTMSHPKLGVTLRPLYLPLSPGACSKSYLAFVRLWTWRIVLCAGSRVEVSGRFHTLTGCSSDKELETRLSGSDQVAETNVPPRMAERTALAKHCGRYWAVAALLAFVLSVIGRLKVDSST
jgi:hypothetical protein